MGYYKDVMNGNAIGPGTRLQSSQAEATVCNNQENETGEQRIARQRQEREARLDAELAAMRAKAPTIGSP